MGGVVTSLTGGGVRLDVFLHGERRGVLVATSVAKERVVGGRLADAQAAV